MDYNETLEFLYTSLPEYQQVGAAAYKPGLDNTLAFNSHLGHPDRRFASVHIAGTNGKGSTSHIMASCLHAAGHKVGLYTSPHLRDFRERIRVDGEMISEDEVVDFVGANYEAMMRLGLSFFEMTVGMAFDHFRRHGVDIAVIETGLGGRLDSTNIITPMLSVITNIGLDHVAMLGNTIPQIAAEKAGIIKAGIPVVVGQSDPQSDAVFEATAQRQGAPLRFADREYRFVSAALHASTQTIVLEKSGEQIAVELDLLGDYQRHNLATALAALHVLGVDRESVLAGCRSAARSTGLAGRWQKIGDRPLTVCDTGHNEHGLREIVAQIGQQEYRRLYMVIGFVSDKELSKILPLLPRDAHYIFTQPSNQRALPAEELAREASKYGLIGEVASSVPAALAVARAKALPEDMIFVGGSTFVVADIANTF